ncbi:hypothetical protein [Brachybacterium sp. FME24]|uniref:hypothetical protein n=1 Tax=Brachybacterium sp. FME24 TaxID=2742605 RepID=UPI0018673381|nr:hypothetical protein [Brachybacterium sp. FME24]
MARHSFGNVTGRRRLISYPDTTGDTASDRVDKWRARIELAPIAYMATSTLLSRRATNAQCADMIRHLSKWIAA